MHIFFSLTKAQCANTHACTHTRAKTHKTRPLQSGRDGVINYKMQLLLISTLIKRENWP